jgi:YVTN family beta-propeller protein
MSDQMDRDMDQTLHGWMQAVAPVRAPARLLEETFSRTVATGQERDFPWRGITVVPRRRILTGPAGWIAVGVAVALVGATIFGTGLLGQPGPTFGPGPSASPSPSVSPSSSPSPPASGLPPTVVAPQATISLQKPLALASDGRALWALTDASMIVRIDTATNSVAAASQFGPIGDLWQGLSASTDALWVTDWDNKLAYRIDPTSLKVVTKVETGLALKGVLVTADAVWIADTHAGTVIRIDPKTNKVVATIPVGPTGTSGPNWLASGLGSIWVDIPNNSTVVRIDPVTNRIQATIPAPTMTGCGGFGIATDAVWLTECAEGHHVGRIDPVSNKLIATVDIGGYGGGFAMVGGAPWTPVDRGHSDDGQIVRINPATNAIDRVVVPGPTFGGGGDVVVLGDSVWVLDGYNNQILRLPLSAFAQ